MCTDACSLRTARGWESAGDILRARRGRRNDSEGTGLQCRGHFFLTNKTYHNSLMISSPWACWRFTSLLDKSVGYLPVAKHIWPAPFEPRNGAPPHHGWYSTVSERMPCLIWVLYHREARGPKRSSRFAVQLLAFASFSRSL